MLRPKAQLSLKNAKEYFREHLCVGDYYAQGRRIMGEWFGQAAAALGLAGVVDEKSFLALCEGQHPVTGEWLTQRRNSTRRSDDGVVANRRIFHDFVFSPPKSVSVVGLYQDVRILELHERAVRIALSELENFAETRVRLLGKNESRGTQNLVGATFQHDTSRELDPHLHTHCVILNATFDHVENRWKALQTEGMYRAQKFVENLYYHELCKGLRLLGYEVANNARDFEIKGVPAEVITRFSKRHAQIDRETRKRIEREGLHANVAALREEVSRSKRRRKIKDSTAARLRPHWEKEMTPAERTALAALRPAAPKAVSPAPLPDIVQWAEKRLFERRAVVTDYELWATALTRGRGESFDLAELHRAVDAVGYVRQPDSRKLTTRDALNTELAVVLAAKDGRFVHPALVPVSAPLSSSLSNEQRRAVEHIFASRDFVTLFRGGAGTGKSFTLKEVERGLSAAGYGVVVVAPQRQQVADLQVDGLPAQTLAQLLLKKRLPEHPVVLLDEAGQVGGADLHGLVKLVQSQQGRLILSGDTHQHGAVAASDALRSIETYAGLSVAEIRSIRRQDPSRGTTPAERRSIRAYRAAVKAASAGRITESFDRLDRIDAVHEVAPEERHQAVAEAYGTALARQENALIVAQTWDEVSQVNEAVRAVLKATDQLGADRIVPTCEPLRWEAAMKRDARYYEPGQHALFMAGYGRFKKGDLVEILSADARGLVLMKDGRRSRFAYRYADRMMVTRRQELALAPGDRLQLKLNGRTADGSALTNGEIVTVRDILPDGQVRVTDAAKHTKTLAPGQCVCVRGYAVTSYASQGKTVDTVLLADSGNRSATNAQQWYVAISRARRRALVFTSDRDALRAAVTRPGERELAMEIAQIQAVTRARQLAALAVECSRARSVHETLRQRRARTHANTHRR